MTNESSDFDKAFARLIAEVKRQADGEGIISFDREIQKPFEAAYAPTSSDALHDLAQLFNGEDGRALFLRLDGPAVYLIVATVLQFPPCSALAEIVFSFMDTLKLCLDLPNVQNAWIAHLSNEELAKRQSTIFLQLIPRLKALLFEDARQCKIRRLVAQFIIEICQKDARGWGYFMDVQKQLLLGDLYNLTDDYVLRTYLSDMLRHLLANNYEIHELWDRASEDVMDFPTSQKLNAGTVAKILHFMSAIDSVRAFRGDRTSRIYHVAEIKISDCAYHSSRSNALIVVDDQLTLLVPDEARDCNSFAAYEVPITQEIFLNKRKVATGPMSYMKIGWTNNQGYAVLRGAKKTISEIRLHFSQSDSQNEFCNVFDRAFEHLAQVSRSTQSQNAQTIQRLQSVVVSEQGDHGAHDTSNSTPMIEHTINSAAKSIGPAMVNPISSDAAVEGVEVSSDVFAFAGHGVQKSISSFALTKRNLQGGGSLTQEYLDTFKANQDIARGGKRYRSSPLKMYARNEGMNDAIDQPYVSAEALALSRGFDKRSDADFDAFLMTASRAKAAHGQAELKADDDRNTQIRPAKGASKRKGDTPKQLVTVQKRSKTASPAGAAGNDTENTVKDNELVDAANERCRGSPNLRVGGLKVALRSARVKHTVSTDVDWDKDLRTDDLTAELEPKSRVGSGKALPRRSLKDVTNTSRGRTANARQRCTNDKETIGNVFQRPPESKETIRRSRRARTNLAISYAESSGSNDSTSETDSSQEEVAKRSCPKGKRSSREAIPRDRIILTDFDTKSSSRNIPAQTSIQSRMASNDSQPLRATRSVIMVPSSDGEDDIRTSKPVKRIPKIAHNQQNKSDGLSAETEAEVEVEVLDDSYPRETARAEVHSIDGDQSFGTKLSNMIASAAATSDGNIFQAKSSLFGNKEQFIHNVNAARNTSSPNKLSVPPHSSTEPEQPRTAQADSSFKPTQQSSGAFISKKDVTVHGDITDTARSLTSNPPSRGGLHSIQDDTVDGSIRAKPGDTEELCQADEEPEWSARFTCPGATVPIVHDSSKIHGQHIEEGPRSLITDRTFVKNMTPAKRGHAQLIDSRSAGKLPQNLPPADDFLDKSDFGPPRLGSGRQKLSSKAVSTPGKLPTVVPDRSNIVHFGTAGPSLRPPKSANKAKHRQKSHADRHSRTPFSIANTGSPKLQASSSGLNLRNDLVPTFELRPDQNVDINSARPVPDFTAASDDPDNNPANDDGCSFADDIDLFQDLDNSVAPADISSPAMESGPSQGRSKTGAQSYKIAYEVQQHPKHPLHENSSTTFRGKSSSTKPTPRSSTQAPSDCIHSSNVITTIQTVSDTVVADKPLIVHSSRDSTDNQSLIFDSHRNSYKECRRIEASHNPASPISAAQPEALRTPSDALFAAQKITRNTSGFPATASPPKHTFTQFSKPFYNPQTPLLTPSKITRNIFSNKKDRRSTSMFSTSQQDGQQQQPTSLENKSRSLQPAEDISSSNFLVKPQAQAGLATATSRRIPNLSHDEMPARMSDCLPNIDVSNEGTDQRQFTTCKADKTFEIVRVNRQDSSPATGPGIIATTMSTPQTFLHDLLTDNSPVIGTRFIHDEEATKYPRSGGHSFQAGEAVDRRRSALDTVVPFSIVKSRVRNASPIASSDCGEYRSELLQNREQDRDSAYPSTAFMSMMEDNVFSVIRRIAQQIDVEEGIMAKQVVDYNTGAVKTIAELKSNGITQIKHDAIKLISTLRDQRHHIAEAKAQLGKITMPIGSSEQASEGKEHHLKRLRAMLDEVKPILQ